MDTIEYGYGSQWHLLRYLGYHRQQLNEYITTATGGSDIEWLDFPFSGVCSPLQDDAAWTCAQALPEVNEAQIRDGKRWQNYWTTTGSSLTWDAVGRITKNRRQEWLLVKAWAHTGEMQAKSKAASGKNKHVVREALDEVAQSVTNEAEWANAWPKEYYEYANRLAVSYFLHDKCVPRIPARLVFIYFYGERAAKYPGSVCPTTAAQWQHHINRVHAEMDIAANSFILETVHNLFVPVNPLLVP